MHNLNDVLAQLKKQNPTIKYVKGNDFKWSFSSKTITYLNNNIITNIWSLIHETAHAQLDHQNYKTDQQLLTLEMQAWQRAKIIAKSLNGLIIDQDHIENCLDTYRDWLHKRATCPNCNVTTLQKGVGAYKCFNCHCSWNVPASPQCKIIKTKLIMLT